MKIHAITNSVFNSRTYVLELFDYWWLVDCGDIEPILKVVGDNRIEGVLLTHGHFDHIYGLNEALGIWPEMKIYCSEHCKTQLFDPKLNYSKFMLATDDCAVSSANGGKPFVLEDRFVGNIKIIDDGYFIQLDDGNGLMFTETMAEILSTPGHDAGCLSYIVDDYFFTGDSYIPGVKTVTNLRGDKSQATESERIIMELISRHGLRIYAGH